MHIEYMYKYIDENQNVIVSGHIPAGTVPLDRMEILTAEEGFVLVKDGEIMGCTVWLRNGDTMENYTEIEEPEEEEHDDNN